MSENYTLWYTDEAKEWTEALPLGNGRIGAMVFSGGVRERIALNEDTLWSGYPRDNNIPGADAFFREARDLALAGKLEEAESLLERTFLGKYTQSYCPLGDLFIDFPAFEGRRIENYQRSLSLEDALSETSFVVDGNRVARHCFISAPDQALIWRMEADEPVCFTANLKSLLRSETVAGDARLELRALCPSYTAPNYMQSDEPVIYESEAGKRGIRSLTCLTADSDGEVRFENGELIVRDARKATLTLCVRTSFNGFDKNPDLDPAPYRENVEADLRHVGAMDYATLLARHLEDHRRLFQRVELHIDGARADLPTDRRLERFIESQDDAYLYELIFQYGRYLLISCSRPGTQAANLQGIWNQSIRPPWSSNYTININTQMNYWPAESCNLSETHEPLFDLISRLVQNGARTARVMYGARGSVSHHNADLWAQTNPVGEAREGCCGYGFWGMSLGWLCWHLMERFMYTDDMRFLREQALPALRAASLFYVDTLVKNEHGEYILCPTTSPENAFKLDGRMQHVSKSAAMTNAIVRETFAGYLRALDALGEDEPEAREVREMLPLTVGFPIGADGRLLEWDAPYEEEDRRHRHSSHMYALHPSRQISPVHTPELAEACRASMEARGDDGTGWCIGWRTNIWARLLDGNRALKLLKRQLRLTREGATEYSGGGGTYPNLFDAHPPFQIDGNFGATAGIAEMLVQSREDCVTLLPALPSEWGNGYVKGLRASHGLTVDIWFADGKLSKAAFTSNAGVPVRIVYKSRALQLAPEKGVRYECAGQDFS